MSWVAPTDKMLFSCCFLPEENCLWTHLERKSPTSKQGHLSASNVSVGVGGPVHDNDINGDNDNNEDDGR